ncbi:HTH_Tnp_Tc3_2 domain-containing protein [Trichonephila clavipes]|uniref:HTH_Tnp_Tc3_2 domain-containing protein n=1 Tax=Trichonephila clavipes TaxID=2585209 RepID=A0A8X6SLV5_TRICX|nr:HTH_Tnp_Tc3_2 domain-containing protein [Trichonephila clavipes]
MWRWPSDQSDPAFVVERRAKITQGVKVWRVIFWDARSPLIILQHTLTARSCVDEILMPVVYILPMLSSHPVAIYESDNARPHTRDSFNDVFKDMAYTFHLSAH